MTNYTEIDILSNETINCEKVETAKKIIAELQREIIDSTEVGTGPFIAAIYDENGKLIAKARNSVLNNQCSNNHAEMNTIRLAEEKLGTYDLSQYNLSIYITAEPCIMCIGGIMWSGIKNVYYGVPSSKVEEITGFDEGFKPNWHEEFKQRGITVYGNIEPKLGEQALKEYINSGKTIYKPSR